MPARQPRRWLQLMLLRPRRRAWLLLITLAAAAATGYETLDDGVAAALAEHLQRPVELLQQQTRDGSADWGGLVRLRRALRGTGFHRDLQLQVALADGAADDAQQQLQQQLRRGGCGLALLQPLPTGVFADPYQLQDLTRSSSSSISSFQLLGPLELELPAPACQPTALLLAFNLTAAGAAALSVPLHAKYPEPLAFGFAGWRALLTGHVATQLPWPWVLLDCGAGVSDAQLLPPPSPSADQQQCGGSDSSGSACSAAADAAQQLAWAVPAGNLDHQALVSWGTLLATALLCVLLSAKALRVTVAAGQGT